MYLSFSFDNKPNRKCGTTDIWVNSLKIICLFIFISCQIFWGGTIDSKNNQLSRGAILNILCYILTWVPNQPIN